MSDLTYATVTSATDLVWGPPPMTANRRLATALQAGYDFVLNDVVGLVHTPACRIADTTPFLQEAQQRIQERAVRLTQAAFEMRSGQLHIGDAAPKIEEASFSIRQTPSLPITQNDAPLSLLHSAPAPMRRTHELMARAELTLARLEATPGFRTGLNDAQQRLRAADEAIARAEVNQAMRLAQEAEGMATKMQKEAQDRAAAQAARARATADALARAGALWVALHGEKGIHTWLERHSRARLTEIGDRLGEARAAYTEEQWDQTIALSRLVETELIGILETATTAIAQEQRDAIAAEAIGILHSLGFETRQSLQEDRRIVIALRGGKRLMTLSFDTLGRFEVDSREGFHGPACSVEVNRFLTAFAPIVQFEVNKHVFCGGPDRDPGHTARTANNRRLLATSDMLTELSRRHARTPVPPQAASAWQRIAR